MMNAEHKTQPDAAAAAEIAILAAFLAKHAHLPGQRSAAWIEGRRFTIGGSEMSNITGDNPYGGLHKLMRSKLGITSFGGSMATYWGTVMEGLVTKILAALWKCEIHTPGSIPAAAPGVSYSPDGVAYVSAFGGIVIIEIKCPFSRVPDGAVPRMYKPQIFTGLEVIDIACRAVFVDALFRVCAIEDAEFNDKYNRDIHRGGGGRAVPIAAAPIMLCLVLLHDRSGAPAAAAAAIDLGAADSYEFVRWMGAAADGKYNVTYHCGGMDEAKMRRAAAAPGVLAFIPVKAFGIYISPVGREEWAAHFAEKKRRAPADVFGNEIAPRGGFLDTWRPTIDSAIAELRRLAPMPREEQIGALDAIFGGEAAPAPAERIITAADEESIIAEFIAATAPPI